jgi:ADP-heptose:LPS heptosyltransferase
LVKFLIIRFSSIGDIVLTTPVIRCLKEQVEEASVHFITKKQFEPVLRENPYIDKLWLLENGIEQIAKELKNEQFDHIIDLHNNLRSSILKRKLKLHSFSFNKLNRQKWLMVNFKINRLPDKHIVDRYMETVSVFDVKNDGKGLDYFLSDEDRIIPAEIKKNLPDRYIVIVAGAQHDTKKVPAGKLAEICDLLSLPVVICGGADDKEEANEVISLSSKRDILNLCGELKLNQSAALIERCDLVISNDTGLMHIAAAFKKKILSIWGNTIPDFGMYPYLPENGSRIFEVKGLKCRPCSKIGFSRCPKRHFRCMMDQDSRKIAEAANNLTGK